MERFEREKIVARLELRAMSESQNRPRCEADSDLEREIREGRKFTPEEAIGRLAGPGAMKGESPVARLRQAEVEIDQWLRSHLVDASGALQVVLHRQVKASELLLTGFDQPLVVLATYCRHVLDSDYLLRDLVREADVEWGRLMVERPHFEEAGSPGHPADPYTAESVRHDLSGLLERLPQGDK